MSTTSRLSGTLPRSRPESTGPLVCGVGSCEKPAVHRYPAAMARRAHGIAQVIVDEYDGETASIWTTAKSGETLYK